MSEVDNMAAGREIDSLVAKQIMGWRTQKIENPMDLKHTEAWIHGEVAVTIHSERRYTVHAGKENSFVIANGPPSFSKDVLAAWSIVQKIVDTLPDCVFTMFHYAGGNTRASFSITKEIKPNGHGPIPTFGPEWSGQAPSMQLAICRASLKVVRKYEGT